MARVHKGAMTLGAILLFGLLVGMQHALEADHVAAVSSLASGEHQPRAIVRHGVVWGVGHALTLMAVAGAAVLLGATIGPGLAAGLELAVGVMLVLLGGQVILRLVRERVHFHVHQHADGTVHLHAHSHRGETTHRPERHEHRHVEPFPLRSLCVGVMHGMAGSAALIVLSATAMPSPALGLIYILLFALGSVAGMALLSTAIALPLGHAARVMTRTYGVLQLLIGGGTVGLGGLTIYQSYVGLLTL